MTLIAKTRIVTGTGEARKEFAAGDDVTGLSAHDVKQLKAMGALADTADQAKDDKAHAQAEVQAAREFAAAREAVQAAQASVQPEAADTTAEDGAAQSTTKAPAAKKTKTTA